MHVEYVFYSDMSSVISLRLVVAHKVCPAQSHCLRHFEVEWEIGLLPLFLLAFVGTWSKFVPQYSSIVQFGTDPVSSEISLSRS